MTAYASHVTAAAWHRGYGLTIEVGIVLSLLAVLGLFHVPLRMDGTIGPTTVEQEVLRIEDVLPTQQPEKPPPPPRAQTPVAVPDESLPDEVPLDLDASLDLNAQLDVPTQAPPPPPQEEEPVEEEAEIFVVVEQMPTIIGGEGRIYDLLEYPEMAAKAGVEGMVAIQFVVNEQGIPVDPVVFKSAGALLDRAAMEAVMQLRFTPGMQRGQPVKVRFTIPVRFRLTS